MVNLEYQFITVFYPKMVNFAATRGIFAAKNYINCWDSTPDHTRELTIRMHPPKSAFGWGGWHPHHFRPVWPSRFSVLWLSALSVPRHGALVLIVISWCLCVALLRPPNWCARGLAAPKPPRSRHFVPCIWCPPTYCWTRALLCHRWTAGSKYFCGLFSVLIWLLRCYHMYMYIFQHCWLSCVMFAVFWSCTICIHCYHIVA